MHQRTYVPAPVLSVLGRVAVGLKAAEICSNLCSYSYLRCHYLLLLELSCVGVVLVVVLGLVPGAISTLER